MSKGCSPCPLRPGVGRSPLARFVSVDSNRRESVRMRKDLRPVVYVTGDVAGSIESPVYAILAMNRGAEDAVGSAAPIFTDAIKQMTLTDALGIVRGNKDAATQYFKQKTSSKLIEAFTPSVKTSLDKTNATMYVPAYPSTIGGGFERGSSAGYSGTTVIEVRVVVPGLGIFART